MSVPMSMQTSAQSFVARIRPHVGALALALAVGILSGLPQHLAQISLGNDFHGVPFLFQDAELVYLTRIHEFQDGHPSVSSPFLHDYKEGSVSLMPPVGEYLFWLVSGYGTFPLTSVVVASKYALPAALFLLVYILTLLLVPRENALRRLSALAAASAVTLGYESVHVSQALSIVFGSYEGTYLHLWTRLVHPVFGALLMFGFLICIRVLLQNRFIAIIPAAIVLALMSGYIFSFGIGFTVAVLYLLLSLWTRAWRMAVSFAAVLGGALLCLVPYLAGTLQSVFSSDPSVGLKTGLFLTHMPLVSAFLAVVLLLVAVSFFYEIFQKKTMSLDSPQVFLFIILLAAFLAMNQQVLTGRTIWPQHFVQYTIPLGMSALLVLYTLRVAPLLRRWAAILPVLVIGGSFLIGFQALPTYADKLDDFRTANRYSALLARLEEMPSPCVVLPVEETEQINLPVTAFTHCDVYFSHYVFSGVPPERIMHNFLVYLRFQGVTPNELEAYLDLHGERVWAVFFRDWKDIFYHSSDPWLLSISDREEIGEWLADQKKAIMEEYEQFYSRSFRDELLKYELQYVLWDSQGGSAFDVSQYPFLEEVFEENGIRVYKIL